MRADRPLCGYFGVGGAPADAGPVGCPAGGVVPGLVEGVQKTVDFFAFHVAVDECFGEAFGDVAGACDVEGVPGQGEGLGAGGVEKYPGGAAAEFVAGAFDK